MSKYFIIAIVSLLLTGCMTRQAAQVNAMPPDQIAQLSDGQMCHFMAYFNNNIYGDKASAAFNDTYLHKHLVCRDAFGREFNQGQSDKILAERCVSAGLAPNSKDNDRCVARKYRELDAQEEAEREERNRQHKIAEARAEKEAREEAKRERAYEARVKKERLDADKAQCDDYGIKRGTGAFSACLMQLDQARQQQKQQEQVLQTQRDMQQQALQAQQQQAALQQQEIERKKREAFLACGGGVTGAGAILSNYCVEHYDHPELWPVNRQRTMGCIPMNDGSGIISCTDVPGIR